MSKRENSSLILQNLKKRDLLPLGEPVVPLDEAERRLNVAGTAAVRERAGEFDGLTSASGDATKHDSRHDSWQDNYQTSHSGAGAESRAATRLKPRERVARSALIVRLDPTLHRQLEQVARFNRLTMNDIAIEAIELHLKNFPHPPDAGKA
jgi:hypothetical protein